MPTRVPLTSGSRPACAAAPCRAPFPSPSRLTHPANTCTSPARKQLIWRRKQPPTAIVSTDPPPTSAETMPWQKSKPTPEQINDKPPAISRSAVSVPRDFLTGPGPTPTVQKLDFPALGLPEYEKHYAIVIDNALSAAECEQLTSLAEASTNGQWERAMVNIGGNEQAMMMHVRNCDRIIWDSKEVVGRIWERVRKHVEGDIGVVKDKPWVMGYGPVRRKEVVGVSRLNERMRFLKYEGGEYFREHCDGQYRTPDNTEFSLYTLHLYLNEATEENKLVGGATTIFDPEWDRDWDPKAVPRRYDVKPKVGRILIFQHRGILHSGEEVESGTKLTMRTDIMYKNL